MRSFSASQHALTVSRGSRRYISYQDGREGGGSVPFTGNPYVYGYEWCAPVIRGKRSTFVVQSLNSDVWNITFGSRRLEADICSPEPAPLLREKPLLRVVADEV